MPGQDKLAGFLACFQNRLNFFRLGLLISAVLVWSGSPAAETKKTQPAKWVRLDGCHSMSEENSDGDSFHVKYGQREFIFRLYFVEWVGLRLRNDQVFFDHSSRDSNDE